MKVGKHKWGNVDKGRHLFQIRGKVRKWKDMRMHSRDQRTISRLRMGHTGLKSTMHPNNV